MKQGSKNKHGRNIDQTLAGNIDNQGFYGRTARLQGIDQHIKYTKQKAGIKKNAGK